MSKTERSVTALLLLANMLSCHRLMQEAEVNPTGKLTKMNSTNSYILRYIMKYYSGYTLGRRKFCHFMANTNIA